MGGFVWCCVNEEKDGKNLSKHIFEHIFSWALFLNEDQRPIKSTIQDEKPYEISNSVVEAKHITTSHFLR